VIFQLYLAGIPAEKLLEDWVIESAGGALVVPVLNKTDLRIRGSPNVRRLTDCRRCVGSVIR